MIAEKPCTCVIFSKDRAMQLDATLRSFFLHCADAHKTARMIVLYKTSSARHAAQYQHLKQEYPNVQFIAEKKFRYDLLGLLNPFPTNSFSRLFYRWLAAVNSFGFRPATLPDQLMRVLLDPFRFWLARRLFSTTEQPAMLLFLVDDNLFTRDFSLTACMDSLLSESAALGFSLRLGRNTTCHYMTDRPQSLPQFVALPSNMLKFRWVDASLDFSYPLEVSSSMYLTSTLLPLMLTIAFRNPNELESALSLRAGFFRHRHPALLCFDQSATFCNPVNLVQSAQPNRSGQAHSADELLERFERGERIAVESYSSFVSNACHQEVELHFTHREET